MILINYKKKNPHKETIDKFTDENRLVSFGVIKTFIAGRFKWLSSFMFKNRNNTKTNKHRAFIGWFGEVENILTEYGNVENINTKVFFNGRERPKFPRFYKELSSKQYGLIGQEYAEYDNIERVDISNKINISVGEARNIINVYHNAGDSPAFVTAGYKINTPEGGDYTAYVSRNGSIVNVNKNFAPTRYVKENPQLQHNIKFNNLEIILGDQVDDILSNPIVKDHISKSDGVSMNSVGSLKPYFGNHATSIKWSGIVHIESFNDPTSESKITILSPEGRTLSFVSSSIGIYFPDVAGGVNRYILSTPSGSEDSIYIVHDSPTPSNELIAYVSQPLMFISDTIIE